jgi:plastocyanin
MRPSRSLVFAPLAILAIAACGGDGGTDNNAPLLLAKTSVANGDGQTGQVSSPLAQQLRVVLTKDGAPRTNTAVTWVAVQGSVSPTTAITDIDGVAVTTWTLGLTAGPQNAKAQLIGANGSPQVFTATGLHGPPTTFTKESGEGQTAPRGTAFPLPLVARVTDAFGNGIAGILVNWSATSGSVVIADPGVATDPQGYSSLTVTAGNTPGPAQVAATTTAVPAITLTYGLTVSATVRDVTVGNTFFRSVTNNSENPAVDTVAVGQPVRWTNTTGTHSVRSLGSPSFTNSPTLSNPGDNYTFTFNTVGTYQYDCGVHLSAMTGTVVVE